MFIRHRSSLENYTRFQTKTAQNPTLWGGTYLYGLSKGVPPPPGLYRNKWYFGKGSKALAANPSRNQVSPRKLQCYLE